ncbi:hypothetical protein NDU88_000367 [Pleurodeles waltl]|uniref:Uncharacterized protein n=1 Tax=Pleurodeles waltl TaxID=8319 RepID=A0AAV7U632_PLEWA|nr:hypothetical protein NDU88_000367 [Pleurodeles waltl]
MAPPPTSSRAQFSSAAAPDTWLLHGASFSAVSEAPRTPTLMDLEREVPQASYTTLNIKLFSGPAQTAWIQLPNRVLTENPGKPQHGVFSRQCPQELKTAASLTQPA